MIITLALRPIGTYQSDTLAFAYKVDRGAIQAVGYVYQQIMQPYTNKKRKVYKKWKFTKKTSKQHYLESIGKLIRGKFRSQHFYRGNARVKKRKRFYTYTY